MKFRTGILFGIIGLIIGAKIFLNWQNSAAQRRTRVQSETRAIASAISGYYAQYDTLPGAQINSASEWSPSSKELYRDFFAMSRPLMLYLNPRWQASLDLVDEWGNSYRFRAVSINPESRNLRLSVWSLGPNGIDDGGTKDDIISVTDLKQ